MDDARSPIMTTAWLKRRRLLLFIVLGLLAAMLLLTRCPAAFERAFIDPPRSFPGGPELPGPSSASPAPGGEVPSTTFGYVAVLPTAQVWPAPPSSKISGAAELPRSTGGEPSRSEALEVAD